MPSAGRRGHAVAEERGCNPRRAASGLSSPPFAICARKRRSLLAGVVQLGKAVFATSIPFRNFFPPTYIIFESFRQAMDRPAFCFERRARDI